MAPACRWALLAAALMSVCASMTVRSVYGTLPKRGEEPLRLGGGFHRSDTLADASRTMAVRGHTVSEVSTQWTGKVVYAIFTSAVPRYRENLLAQLETWAARPAAEGRYIAVGGNNYPRKWQTKSILRSECTDEMEGISCKEATLLAEGAARGADWLVVVGEDNYVHTRHVEAALSDKDPDEPVAYGVVGCGKEPNDGVVGCGNGDLLMEEQGGFCGGNGYILSRATLQMLLVDGAPALHKVYDQSTAPNDMTTSCQLRKHGAELRDLDGLFGFEMIEKKTYDDMIRGSFLTVHLIKPNALRYIHAHIENATDSVKKDLEEKAFANGCAIEMKDRYPSQFAKCYFANESSMAWPEKN